MPLQEYNNKKPSMKNEQVGFVCLAVLNKLCLFGSTQLREKYITKTTAINTGAAAQGYINLWRQLLVICLMGHSAI